MARAARGALAAAILLFAVAPLPVLVLAAFDDGNFFRFPPRALSLRWFEAAWESREYRASLGRSALVATLATALAVPLGGLAALALVRGRLPARGAVEALLMAPLALPLVVWAITLLQVYAWLGVSGSLWGLVAAHVILVLPFALRLIAAALARIDPALEEAARSLGAPPVRAFARTTLPLARGGIGAAAALCFALSFNDVVVATFLAGAGWTTYPVRMYAQLRGEGVDPTTLAIGAAVVAATLATALAVELWPRRGARR